MKKFFSVGEAAKAVGMTAETLRHYDRIGLVSPCKTDEWTGYRYYSEQELARLQKEKEKAEKDQASVRAKLANESFVAKAPAQVVQAERDKLALIQDRLEKIEASIRAMQ